MCLRHGPSSPPPGRRKSTASKPVVSQLLRVGAAVSETLGFSWRRAVSGELWEPSEGGYDLPQASSAPQCTTPYSVTRRLIDPQVAPVFESMAGASRYLSLWR